MLRAALFFIAALAVPAAAQAPRSDPDLRVVDDVVEMIRKDYVTPVDDAVLVASCKRGLAEFMKSPAPESPQPRPLGRVAPADEIRELLITARAARPQLDPRALTDACLRAMVDGLDRNSSYLDRDAFRDLQVGAGGMAGLGLELKIENELPLVVSVIENTPAARGDVQGGDLILKIDDYETRGQTLQESIKHMRGKPNSKVVLTLRRGASEIQRELTREIIRVASVKAQRTPEGYLHVRLSQFGESTVDNLARELRAAYGEGGKAPPGIILDLRGNPGGLLNGSVAVAAAFLADPVLVVEIKGRNAEHSRRFRAVAEDYMRGSRDDTLKGLPREIKTVPLVVIVDHRSAGGSEIVAAALQDHRRAKVIGERTFGMGSIGTIIPAANNTAVKLTTAKFHRPSGAAIEGNAVVPDVVLSAAETARPQGTEPDRALPHALKLLQKK